MRKEFEWNANTGIATCIITYNNVNFIGQAHCHPDDADFQSELTGSFIAELRANIKCLKFMKNHEIRSQLVALNHTLGCIKMSQKYDPNCHAVKTLQRQIYLTTEELTTIKQQIATLEQELNTYIANKEKFYKSIRRARS